MVWQYLQHEDSAGCYLIVWNEGEWERTVSKKIFGSSPPKPKECSSVKECSPHFYELEQELAKKYVVKRLAVKNMPSFQLQQELSEHLISPAISIELITRFQKEGYIDDEAWLRSYVWQQKQKKLACVKIIGSLQQKGADENLVALAEEMLSEEDTDLELCSAALSKLLKTKFKNWDREQFQEKQKVCGALARKGFSFDTIQRALEVIEL